MDERYPYTLTHSDDRSPTKDSALVLIYRGKITILLKLLKCIVIVEDENLGNAARRLKGRKNGILRRWSGGVLVHPSFSGQQPVHIDLREMEGHRFQEIEAWFVPSGKDVRNAGSRNAERLGQLCL